MFPGAGSPRYRPSWGCGPKFPEAALSRSTPGSSQVTSYSSQIGSPVAVAKLVSPSQHMRNLLELAACFGRCFIAVAIIAFGVQHLVYADFVTRLAPKLPAAIPGHVLLACAFGIYLIGSGFALLSKKTARPTALLLAASLFASLAFLYAPALAVNLGDVSLWTKAGKALTLSGGALLIAGSLPAEFDQDRTPLAIITLPLAKCIPFARYFLGGFFAYCGVLHFIYVNFVTGLVPSWIPGPVFWTYFSGVALFAAGLGIGFPPTTRLAAALSALMVFLWVLMLHIPRALADLRDSNETTAVFEAIAVSGTALVIAAHPFFVQQRLRITGTNPNTLSSHDLLGIQNVPIAHPNRPESTQL
jgi:uncharacterized membrane protein